MGGHAQRQAVGVAVLVLEHHPSLFVHRHYEVSDHLLIFCTDLGELDSLTPIICPDHLAGSVDSRTGNG
jgi:hypothetical protein